MKIKRKHLFKALEENGEIAGKDNPFKPAYLAWKPKALIIIEKLSVFEKIKEEIKKQKYYNTISIVCCQGFPADYLTTESIKRVITTKTKVYYFGDLDSISFCIYHALRKGDSLLKKSVDKLKINYLGIISNDLKNYGVPNNYLIKLSKEEAIVLKYIQEQGLVPELSKEIKFLKSNKRKLELEGFYLALKNKELTFLDYFKDKKVL